RDAQAHSHRADCRKHQSAYHTGIHDSVRPGSRAFVHRAHSLTRHPEQKKKPAELQELESQQKSNRDRLEPKIEKSEVNEYEACLLSTTNLRIVSYFCSGSKQCLGSINP